MIPTNEKSLFNYMLILMEKVMNDEVSSEQAQTVINAEKEAEKLLKNEMQRARLQMEINDHNRQTGDRIQIRELASKGFTNTTVLSDGTPNL